MGIAVVQGTTLYQTTDSLTVDYTDATTEGNTLLLGWRTHPASDTNWPTSVTDTGGNTWSYPTAVNNASPPGASQPSPVLIGFTVDAASATSVTIDVASSAYLQQAISLCELSGVGSAGPGASASNSAESYPSVSIDYEDGDAIIAVYYGNLADMGNPPDFTPITDSETGGENVGAWIQVMSGSGTLTIDWPDEVTGGWGVCVQAFHPAASSPASQNQTGYLDDRSAFRRTLIW